MLDYLISPDNLRPVLLPALLANPSVSDESLMAMAPKASRDVVELMLKSTRINLSIEILKALFTNPNLNGIQSETVRMKIEPPAPVSAPEVEAADSKVEEVSKSNDESERKKTSPSRLRPEKYKKAKRCSTKALWPTFPNTPLRFRPRPTKAFSLSAEFTKSFSEAEPQQASCDHRLRRTLIWSSH